MPLDCLRRRKLNKNWKVSSAIYRIRRSPMREHDIRCKRVAIGDRVGAMSAIIDLIDQDRSRRSSSIQWIRLYTPTTCWQFGHEWTASLQASTQNGIRQQPSQHLSHKKTVWYCLHFEREASNRTETDKTGAVRQFKLKVNRLEQNAPSCREKLTMLEQNAPRLG